MKDGSALNLGIGLCVAILLSLAMLQCIGTEYTLDYIKFETDVVQVNFSEPMDTMGLFDPVNYYIQTGPDFDRIPEVIEVYQVLRPDSIPTDSITFVYVICDTHTTGEQYVISVTGVFDWAGNRINMEKNYKVYSNE
jgi:hypothetical protein